MVGLVGLVLLLGACSEEPARVPDVGTVGEPVGASDAPVEPRALSVLHAWDERRAAAYSRGDVAALRRLYTGGSTAAARDASVLRRYVARGLRVDGLRMQVLAAKVLREDDFLVRLRVRERVLPGLVVGPHGTARLPVDRADRHVVTLVRRRGAWLVRSVTTAEPP